MIKLTFAIDDLGYGGAQRQLSLVAPALAARTNEVDVSVVCMSEVTTPFAAVLRGRGVELATFPRRGGVDVSRVFALRRLLQRRSPDIAHAFTDAAGVYTFLASRGMRHSVVTSMRSDRISFGGVRARVLASIHRRADAIVTNSEAGRTALVSRHRVDPARVTLVRNCVEPAPVNESHDSPVVGFVGRLVPLKRADRLVDAFARAAGELPEGTRMVLVGEGPERPALESLVSQHGLGARVTFAGNVEDARALLGTFSCLVQPSRNEGLPNTVLEALAAGVPVVASRAGDIPDVVEDGRTGLLVDGGDAGELASAIVRAVRDDDFRRGAREAGPRFIEENFSAERAVETLVALYRGLVR